LTPDRACDLLVVGGGPAGYDLASPVDYERGLSICPWPWRAHIR